MTRIPLPRFLLSTFAIIELGSIIFLRVLQEFGEERALEAMGIFSLRTTIDLDRQIAIHAAQNSNELKLTMADSIVLATARAYDATLWTQDEHLKDIESGELKEKRSRK